MIRNRIEDDLKDSFEEFFVQAFAKTHKAQELDFEPYLRYVCDRYQHLRKGDRIVFNQPPRTLKSWTAKFFAAWYLGRHPSHEVMIISNTQRLAETITYDIRKILRADSPRTFPEHSSGGVGSWRFYAGWHGWSNMRFGGAGRRCAADRMLR